MLTNLVLLTLCHYFCDLKLLKILRRFTRPTGVSYGLIILRLVMLLGVLVILYLILFMAIDKHDQSAGVCK